MDWALHQPVPWRAAECAQAGTVHLGGTLDEISDSERRPWRGEVSDRPYVLFTQPSLFDPARAPAGKHTAWGYCHVPNGYTGNMAETIEKQVERFAPGFRDCIAARSIMGPAELERHKPTLIGGDISGGAAYLSQLFLRPTASLYRTPLEGVFLCSSSTPPAPGVHGMCGYFAAEAALKGKALNDASKKGDAVIFDGVAPDPAPRTGHFLFIDPHGPASPWPDHGTVSDPVVTDVLRDHPIGHDAGFEILDEALSCPTQFGARIAVAWLGWLRVAWGAPPIRDRASRWRRCPAACPPVRSGPAAS
jgi:hypothetical protein